MNQQPVNERLEKMLQEMQDVPAEQEARPVSPPTGYKKRPSLKRKLVSLALLLILMFVVLPPFYLPVKGIRTSGYFFRIRPESQLFTDIEFHKGLDLAAPTGTPVLPSAIGIVERVDWSPTYGNVIVLRHLFGMETVYAHLSQTRVNEGRLVFPGISPIAAVGETGRATGPHLHFEIRVNGASLPPGFFLIFHNIRKQIVGF